MKKIVFCLYPALLSILLFSCTSEMTASTDQVDLDQHVSISSQPESVQTENAQESSKETTAQVSVRSTEKALTKVQEKKSEMDPLPEGKMTEFIESSVSSSLPVPVVEQVEETYDFHAYERLDDLLRSHVSSSGKVNYNGIKRDAAKLDSVIQEFQDNYPGSGWSSTQKLTYWINAYNLFTIKLIVDNYPVSSITKITAKPWEKKFIQLGGKTYDLNTIENGIIRKQFNEPRIHFALNCASESCPILLNRAYTPSKLYSQLTTQTKKFLNDGTKNDFSDPKNIKISSIFDWYGEDFKKSGTVIDFINKYRTEQLGNPKISYMPYSWNLND